MPPLPTESRLCITGAYQELLFKANFLFLCYEFSANILVKTPIINKTLGRLNVFIGVQSLLKRVFYSTPKQS